MRLNNSFLLTLKLKGGSLRRRTSGLVRFTSMQFSALRLEG
jgi:hypothetical protein